MKNNEKKKIILIGGNSTIVQEILKNNEYLESYSEIFIICHRRYIGIKKNYKILESIDPSLAVKIIEDIFYTDSIELSFDIIFANTPPQNANYKDFNVVEWGITSIKIMHMLSLKKEVNRVIILGSSLSLIPFLHSDMYKSIKKLEFYCYNTLRLNKSEKICFFILPPIGEKIIGIGKFFAQSRLVWSRKIMNELRTNNNLIVPDGISGILIRILLLFNRL